MKWTQEKPYRLCCSVCKEIVSARDNYCKLCGRKLDKKAIA